jgi:hypothetical protein
MYELDMSIGKKEDYMGQTYTFDKEDYMGQTYTFDKRRLYGSDLHI